MATYFHGSNNQREASPIIYTREPYPEPSPVISTMYMNYFSSNSSTNEMPPPQQEIDFPDWGNGRGEMPFMPLLGSATSLLQGVQNLQGQSQGQGQSQNQGLSLSLSTQIPNNLQIQTMDFRNPNPNGFTALLGPNDNSNNALGDDENLPNKQMKGGEYYGENLSSYGVGRAVPNSRYLGAAQELLDEVVNVRNALKKQDSKRCVERVESGIENSASEAPSNSANELSTADKQDLQNKLSKFLTMLDEVDRRYKQYHHQMQIVVASFDAIAGPGAARPYTSLALQTISRHFRALRDAVAGQIQHARKSLGEEDEGGKGVGISRLRFVDQQLKQQRALQQLGMMHHQQHAWRPQRGLPETSVSILRAWLFEHFLHPYPKDSEKLMLARQTGLTRSQVSNWFINARVRLWKPMVEEMYREETGDAEIDSISSPETGTKATKDDTQCLQQSANSTEQSQSSQFIESKHSLISNLDDGGLFQGYHIPGFERFSNPNSVSLTLGLQHCEGGSFPISVDTQNYAIYNAESTSVGPQSSDFDMDNENR